MPHRTCTGNIPPLYLINVKKDKPFKHVCNFLIGIEIHACRFVIKLIFTL